MFRSSFHWSERPNPLLISLLVGDNKLLLFISPLMNAVKMGWGNVYEFWYVASFSHYSYQLEAYIALLHTNMPLAVHLFHIGRENPTVYTSASAVPTWSMWSTLLPRPRLRWTAMWAFPSNIAQRLASGHPLTGNYFFSSLMLDDNLYLCVAVCLAHWCGGGGHHGILAKKAWRRGVWLWIPDRSGTSRFFDWRKQNH